MAVVKVCYDGGQFVELWMWARSRSTSRRMVVICLIYLVQVGGNCLVAPLGIHEDLLRIQEVGGVEAVPSLGSLALWVAKV